MSLKKLVTIIFFFLFFIACLRWLYILLLIAVLLKFIEKMMFTNEIFISDEDLLFQKILIKGNQIMHYLSSIKKTYDLLNRFVNPEGTID